MQKKVAKISDKLDLSLDVFFFSNVEKNLIKDKYKIETILKESTFSFVYQVGL